MSDYEAAVALWRECEGVGLSEADSREAIEAYLERNPASSFLACTDAAVVGAALSGHDGRRGYLYHLAVHPEHRRRGIGRALFGRCVEALRGEGITKCHIFVFAANDAALSFWKSSGWEYREELVLFSYPLRLL